MKYSWNPSFLLFKIILFNLFSPTRPNTLLEKKLIEGNVASGFFNDKIGKDLAENKTPLYRHYYQNPKGNLTKYNSTIHFLPKQTSWAYQCDKGKGKILFGISNEEFPCYVLTKLSTFFIGSTNNSREGIYLRLWCYID